MDPRLTQLPDPALEDRIDGLIHEWCSLPVDLCPCNPRPLPEPKPSATVRTIQRGVIAESAAEPAETPDGVTTPERSVEAASEPHSPQNGPVCGLFPPKRGAA